MLMMSPDQLIEEMFEREEVKACLASLAAWSQLPLNEPGSGGTMGIISAYSMFGCSRPVGGAGEFTGALAACVEDHGGTIRTSARVSKILVRDGVAYGVALENGEELHARQVIGAIPPTPLIRDMLDPEYVPDKVLGELRSLRTSSANLAPMSFHLALEEMPNLVGGRDELWEGLMLIAPTIEHVRRAQASCMRGEVPADLMLCPVLPSKIDRSLVPRGSKGETMYVYLPAVPFDIEGDDWDSVQQPFGDAIIDELDRYAPGLKSKIIGRYAKTPLEIGRQVYRGSLYHVDMCATQLGPNRPTPSLSGYRTPVEGLWHTAAGAHPMGALNGWSGRTTARTVERRLRSQPAGRYSLNGSVSSLRRAVTNGNGRYRSAGASTNGVNRPATVTPKD
jgi:phytoene dehydrogenase-like protein